LKSANKRNWESFCARPIFQLLETFWMFISKKSLLRVPRSVLSKDKIQVLFSFLFLFHTIKRCTRSFQWTLIFIKVFFFHLKNHQQKSISNSNFVSTILIAASVPLLLKRSYGSFFGKQDSFDMNTFAFC
jgi:hypothetical protein